MENLRFALNKKSSLINKASKPNKLEGKKLDLCYEKLIKVK
jgi:hypothetical protein